MIIIGHQKEKSLEWISSTVGIPEDLVDDIIVTLGT